MRALLSNRVLALVALVAVLGASVAEARTAPNRPRRPRATNLFAGANLLFGVNRVLCNLTSTGEVCSAGSSPVGGGGFWPNGTPDQYIFNSGLQIGGLVDPAAPFDWAGDTVATFFFDASGGQEAGEAIFGVYNSLDPADQASWPNGAVARDPDIYAPGLLGLTQVSQGDAWTRYWEGNPDRGTGRPHPLGIVVDQRVLAYGFPAGNEDILYIIFTFYNVSAKASSGAYNNPTIPAELQTEIGALGDRFQAVNEAKFGAGLIPDDGYTITDMYAGFAMDADVAIYSHNYATAILPFNIGMTYAGDFLPEVGWTFPPDVFGPPFFAAPGFVGVKYLRSPTDALGNQVGLTMFSQHFNPNQGSGLLDPEGGNQLYRYLSGYFGTTDASCSPFTNRDEARARRLCYLGQTQGDARFYQASGPFNLEPGKATSIVVAYINAAPLDTVETYVGGDVLPGIPFTGDSIFNDSTKIRLVERIAGWVTQSDANADQVITQDEVTTVQYSLLSKAQTAQTIFDAGFAGAFAPEAPSFFLVPGDQTVTVVWQPSRTEDQTGTGDPYFGIAGNPASSLYDPNYRQFDVEGYRVYRGRSASELQLIAQFDYSGTAFIDYTGVVAYGDADGDGLPNRCAFELGVFDDCPAELDFSGGAISPTGHAVALVGDVVQNLGERKLLADGGVILLSTDTLVTGGAPKCQGECPPLTDVGLPFALVDRGLVNGISYVYAVTAFDANSAKSGPSSLESARITKRITPRAPGRQEAAGQIVSNVMLGGDGSTLDPTAPVPDIDPVTGRFAGPMPPTDGMVLSFPAFVSQLIEGGELTLTLDSLSTGFPPGADVLPTGFQPTVYYFTADGPAGATDFHFTLPNDYHDGVSEAAAPFPFTPLTNGQANRYGGDSSYALFGRVDLATPGGWLSTSVGRGNANGVVGAFNGPRWWAGATNETTDDPNGGHCNPAGGTCANGGQTPDIARSAGSIAGVQIFHPASYLTVQSSPGRLLELIFATVTRAADFAVYWGAAGVVDSVMDLTHKVPVSFSPKIGPTWGILNAASFAATTQATTRDANNARLTWSDMYCVEPAPAFIGTCGGAAQTEAVLQNTAVLNPINFATSSYAGTATLAAGAATGDGFIFYLAGQYFVMQTATLPAATTWYVRYYTGDVSGEAATATNPDTPAPFAYDPIAARPPSVPGLRFRVVYEASVYDSTTVVSLDRVHTVPDPYYVTNAMETTANTKVLNFVNLPSQAIIRIYSLSGVLVQVLSHNDATDGGSATWNLRNRNNQFVASGVYFYHVETPTGQTKVGRFTVVNFAP